MDEMYLNPEVIDTQKHEDFLPTTWKMELLFTLLGTIGLTILTELIFLVVLKSFPDLEQTALLTYVNTARYLLILLVFLALFYHFKLLKPLFAKFANKRALVTGLAYGALVIIISILYSELSSLFFPFEGENENQTLVLEIIRNYPILSFIWIPFFGPFVEEMTYRFGLFSLLKRYNKYIAYALVGLIFGLIHFNLPLVDGTVDQAKLVVELVSLPSYIISGILFAYIYEKEGIASATYAHILNNLLSFILTIVQMYV